MTMRVLRLCHRYYIETDVQHPNGTNTHIGKWKNSYAECFRQNRTLNQLNILLSSSHSHMIDME